MNSNTVSWSGMNNFFDSAPRCMVQKHTAILCLQEWLCFDILSNHWQVKDFAAVWSSTCTRRSSMRISNIILCLENLFQVHFWFHISFSWLCVEFLCSSWSCRWVNLPVWVHLPFGNSALSSKVQVPDFWSLADCFGPKANQETCWCRGNSNCKAFLSFVQPQITLSTLFRFGMGYSHHILDVVRLQQHRADLGSVLPWQLLYQSSSLGEVWQSLELRSLLPSREKLWYVPVSVITWILQFLFPMHLETSDFLVKWSRTNCFGRMELAVISKRIPYHIG